MSTCLNVDCGLRLFLNHLSFDTRQLFYKRHLFLYSLLIFLTSVLEAPVWWYNDNYTSLFASSVWCSPFLSHTQYKHMKTIVQEHVYMCHRGKHKKKKNRGRRNYSAKSVSDSGCLCLNCLKSPYIAATSKSIVLILYLTSCYKKQYLIC